MQYLKYDWYSRGTEFFNLILSNLNSHAWLVPTILDKIVVECTLDWFSTQASQLQVIWSNFLESGYHEHVQTLNLTSCTQPVWPVGIGRIVLYPKGPNF